ncbi:choice-of-anchor Q domain-containing protein [Spirosoma liriopis]|uniref:choice-of-anchor Q domain-containing protein n=1 Tax=Spirosoma liriopis TaxID=2937440 RepID=UPI0020C154BB
MFSRLLLAKLLVLSFCFSSAQSIVYVTEGGAGNLSGSSWANALPSSQLQSRLSSLGAGSQVWVAAGTYKPTTTTNRAISFSMRNGVAIYGGFIGTESSPDQRPPISPSKPSSTTLSGDIGTTGLVNDNTYHIISNTRLDSTAILDGFVIALGNQEGSTTLLYGAGMLNSGEGAGNYCSPTIRNCFFTKNRAENGGAVYNNGDVSGSSSPQFINCIFEQNTASNGDGGAVKSSGYNGSCAPVFINCQFNRNTSEYNGGAVCFLSSYVGNNKPSFVNCLFNQNTAYFYAGALYFGIAYNGVSTPIMLNCTFTKNRITQTASAIYFNDYQNSVKAKLVNCIAWGNTGQYASELALYSYRNYQDVTYSDIQGNTSGIGVYPGTGNIIADPLFVDPATNDFQLKPTSPCINTGDPSSSTAMVGSLDLSGSKRLQAGRIDMGAYEYQGSDCSSGMYTLQNGLWSDATIWSCGRVPTATDAAVIKHRITLSSGYIGTACRVTFETGSQLIYALDAKLQLSQ